MSGVDNRLRPLGKEEYKRLVRVARGQEPADIYLRGGTVINVYTRELCRANVAICGNRIAYVGESDAMRGPETVEIDAVGRFLCPGYLEPHAHPFPTQVLFPLAEQALARGTTAMVCDNLFLFQVLNEDGLKRLVDDLVQLPVKIFWSARLDPQTSCGEARAKFDPARVSAFLASPAVRQVGELTDWPALLAGDDQWVENMCTAQKMGKRAEGHAPGASWDTLNALAAAGVTACHESMEAGEVINRLRLGYYAALRFSTLRPDLPQLVRGIKDAGVSLHRVMLTTDYTAPPLPGEGFTDRLLQLVMQEGVRPLDAYPMATLNVATYYGLDDQLGGIAPGRLADVLVLDAPDNPSPSLVFADGKLVAENQRPKINLKRENWKRYGLKAFLRPRREISPDIFMLAATGRPFPVMDLVNPVITRRRDLNVPERHGLLDVEDVAGLHYAAILDREMRWVCTGLITGFADHIDGLATSYTVAGGALVLGRNPEDMALAARRVFDLQGGTVLVERGSVLAELPLPTGEIMPVEDCMFYMQQVPTLRRLVEERGHRHYDLHYTFLFLSATHLPELRLSPAGLWEVKERRVLLPARKL